MRPEGISDTSLVILESRWLPYWSRLINISGREASCTTLRNDIFIGNKNMCVFGIRRYLHIFIPSKLLKDHHNLRAYLKEMALLCPCVTHTLLFLYKTNRFTRV